VCVCLCVFVCLCVCVFVCVCVCVCVSVWAGGHVHAGLHLFQEEDGMSYDLGDAYAYTHV
jgi:hypothetical protein